MRCACFIGESTPSASVGLSIGINMTADSSLIKESDFAILKTEKAARLVQLNKGVVYVDKRKFNCQDIIGQPWDQVNSEKLISDGRGLVANLTICETRILTAIDIDRFSPWLVGRKVRSAWRWSLSKNTSIIFSSLQTRWDVLRHSEYSFLSAGHSSVNLGNAAFLSPERTLQKSMNRDWLRNPYH